MTTYLLILVIIVLVVFIASFFIYISETTERPDVGGFAAVWVVIIIAITIVFGLGMRHATSTPIKWSQEIKEPKP